ncbi:MAG TPA: urease accessory protein UreF [Geminicoccus sp.]|uniref:urease accessory protein UreF n=1 Tax=Geminicoccus sp. TaxID=2024832 RepID=UPI002E34FB7B|nr:urease accessory protein UreF [Geminicoccus sp.]HEX2526502.1 urease accessory protein UreF [Geminicoccus sp.]
MVDPLLDDRSLLRLLAWSSPSFPIGAFAFSHGLEAAVEEGLVTDAASLLTYLRQACRHGSGFADLVLMAQAYRRADDPDRLTELIEWAAALRGTAELALEAGMQGGAALRTLRLAWPHPALDGLAELARQLAVEPVLPVVNGMAAWAHGLPLPQACLAQLAAFSANLVSAGVRLVPLGQTDGQRVTASLEQDLPAVVADALATPLEELATSTPMIDLLSIAHETQYTRLFRS